MSGSEHTMTVFARVFLAYLQLACWNLNAASWKPGPALELRKPLLYVQRPSDT